MSITYPTVQSSKTGQVREIARKEIRAKPTLILTRGAKTCYETGRIFSRMRRCACGSARTASVEIASERYKPSGISERRR